MLGDAKIMAFAATANADAARAFYESILGLRLVVDDGFALVFDANGTTLRIAKVDAVAPPPYTSLGWTVADAAATARALTAKGVVMERFGGMEQDDLGLWSVGPVRIGWFRDPDGNLLSITGP